VDTLLVFYIYNYLLTIVQWHELSRAEQTRYYEMARQEKELHAKSNPSWSARDNYGLHSKRKKKREITCQHTPDKGMLAWRFVSTCYA
jgi:hypothetical protein